MKHFYIFTPVVVMGFCLGATSAVALTPTSSFSVSLSKSDCHIHLVDFLQNGEYWSEKEKRFIPPSPKLTLPQGKRGARLVGLLKRMETAGVSYAMVSGMPFVKKWSSHDRFRSKYYLDSESRVLLARDTDYIVALSFQDFLNSGGQSAIENRKKLFPFICGFDATDMGAVDMIVKRIKEFPGLWEGIGEIMSRHDDLTNLTADERPYADHPALHRICDFAGAANLPVSIHHNIAPVSTGTEFKDPLYLPELETLFDAHPSTTFIWCHAGISRRINVNALTEILDRLLSKNDRKTHVKIDLSWVIADTYIYAPKKGLDNRDLWADLIEKYPDTFMIGSDKVATFSGYSDEINKFAPLFETLSKRPNGQKLVTNLARDNFYNTMISLRAKRGGSGAILPEDYQYPEENYIKRTETFNLQNAKPTQRQL